jgi:hypothetical protein
MPHVLELVFENIAFYYKISPPKLPLGESTLALISMICLDQK